MRSTSDRVRHAVSFEILGIALVTPAASWAFALPGADTGVVAIGSATVAMVWNYGYNVAFDHALKAIRGTLRKSFPTRIVHTLIFEIGLLVVLVPMIAGYLGIGLRQALLLDLSLALFYVLYALAFNWLYDRVFPAPA